MSANIPIGITLGVVFVFLYVEGLMSLAEWILGPFGREENETTM